MAGAQLKEKSMAQTTRTPPPTHTPRTPAPEPKPEPVHETPAAATAPKPVMPMVGMPPMITDRNLLDQLRQIYQTSQRHLPVPSGTSVSKVLEDALDEIGEIANKAVTDYTP